jgi:transposase
MEQRSRKQAAEACGMDRQTLRDWVHRYNDEGVEGLYNRPKQNGPKPRLSPEQEAQVAAWVEQGPDQARDGVVRWRCVDLRDRIQQDFSVQYHERSVGKLLNKLAFRRLSVRPQHPESDAAEQELFKKASLTGRAKSCRRAHKASRSRFGSRMRRVLASRAR